MYINSSSSECESSGKTMKLSSGLVFFIIILNILISSAAPNPKKSISNGIPCEPLNPSEFEEAAEMDYDENTQGSHLYENEAMFQNGYDKRNGLVDGDKLWPKFGEFVFIPYIISSHFNPVERHKIVKAFENFHENTCIRFIPWTHQEDYVYIIYGDGCDSEAGRVGGGQTISLGRNCNFTHVAIHEINHAVGFWHEHNRPDRDKYINVYMENVMPENQYNFDRLSSRVVSAFGQKYDTDSIMHYDEYAFSIDPGNLIVLEPEIPNEKMGYARKLSKSDIIKINRMYDCIGSAYNPKVETSFLSGKFCKDAYSDCGLIDKSNCKTNIWMKVNCKESCSRCGTPCEDLHKKCRSWALRGACQTQLTYMYIYCPKSCLQCQTMSNN